MLGIVRGDHLIGGYNMSHIFKEGELVFYPPVGFVKLKAYFQAYDNHPFFIDAGDFSVRFTKLGKLGSLDKYPTLLTLEQAAKLGYYPEKKKVKKWRWAFSNRHDSPMIYVSELYLTESKAKFLFDTVIQKIDSTEIEVEE